VPYISTDIIIAGTKFDRRIKLTDKDKQAILTLYHSGGYTYAEIGKKFNVDRRTISFIVNPEELKRNKELRLKRGGWKQYYNKEEHTDRISEYRQYKQKLYLLGMIKNNKYKGYKVVKK
jgi:IS30 family transposase